MQNGDRGFKIRLIAVFKNMLLSACSVCTLLASYCLLFSANASADELRLRELLDEALKNSPELLASESRVAASRFRIPQAESLPDPMFMFGYQNEGWSRYTYGDSLMSQWMFSASQTFPFPGKLALKGEMATRDSETLDKSREALRLRLRQRVREIYYDLFLAYKDIDLLQDKSSLLSSVEDAALARYSSGMGSQQEVLMAQTEKYMLLERQEMLKQKIQSLEAMLNTTVGRDVNAPLGRPVEPVYNAYGFSLDDLIKMAYQNSPEIQSKERAVAAADTKVKLAKKEYYPDFTLTGSVMKKAGPFEDMWSLTATVNIPLYYRTKQRQAVFEAEASLSEAKHELQAVKLMLSSSIRDNYSMVRTAEKLMDLYKSGLMPKAGQDFEAAISGYTTGKVEAVAVMTSLKSYIEAEILYWGQFVEREKAIARFEAMAGVMDLGGGEGK